MSTPTLEIDGKPVDIAEAERQFHQSMAAPEPDEPVAPAPPRVDQEAPYGRKADGTPRQRAPGPGRGNKSRTTAGSSASSASKTESAADAHARRTQGIQGTLGLVGGVLMVASGESVALQADAITVVQDAEPFGDAVADAAAINPKFAAQIDRLINAGPYAALFAIGIKMTAQIASNHGIAAARMMPGTKTPEDLVSEYQSASSADTA
jgi:hypothetical protein